MSDPSEIKHLQSIQNRSFVRVMGNMERFSHDHFGRKFFGRK